MTRRCCGRNTPPASGARPLPKNSIDIEPYHRLTLDIIGYVQTLWVTTYPPHDHVRILVCTA
ncbi:MAG TPA: hypothetical protein VKP30_09335, partial [Polyangiaceae bacterium]|nr:hypothetical protein [Polyangiaceae bacterium]